MDGTELPAGRDLKIRGDIAIFVYIVIIKSDMMGLACIYLYHFRTRLLFCSSSSHHILYYIFLFYLMLLLLFVIYHQLLRYSYICEGIHLSSSKQISKKKETTELLDVIYLEEREGAAAFFGKRRLFAT